MGGLNGPSIETHRVRQDPEQSGRQERTFRGRDGGSDGGLLPRQAWFQGDNIEGGGDRVRLTRWRLPRVGDSEYRPRDDEDGTNQDGERSEEHTSELQSR